MSIDRRQYVKKYGTHESLAKACKITTKTVQRWIAGENVDPETHEAICKALKVHVGFFESSARVRNSLEDALEDLEAECPQFVHRLKRIARVENQRLFNAICNDLEQSHGSGLISPAIGPNWQKSQGK